MIGALNAVTFTTAALRYRLPQAHIPALACLAVASVTAFHAALGNLAVSEAASGRRLLALAASPPTGSLLCFLAVVLALSAEWPPRRRHRADALYHVAASGVAGVVAMLLVSMAGAEEPGRVALVFGVCGSGCLLVNFRWRLPQLSYVGVIVLLGAIGCTLRWVNSDLPGQRLVLLTFLTEHRPARESYAPKRDPRQRLHQ